MLNSRLAYRLYRRGVSSGTESQHLSTDHSPQLPPEGIFQVYTTDVGYKRGSRSSRSRGHHDRDVSRVLFKPKQNRLREVSFLLDTESGLRS